VTKTISIPAEFDRHALEVARGIASIDRARLPGSTTQFVAILQTAIVQSMMMAAERSPVTDAEMAKAMREVADCRAMIREVRGLDCANFPREVVEALLGTIDQLLDVAEAAVRDVAPCAKSRTGGVPTC
jgi:hypothetical protein